MSNLVESDDENIQRKKGSRKAAVAVAPEPEPAPAKLAADPVPKKPRRKLNELQLQTVRENLAKGRAKLHERWEAGRKEKAEIIEDLVVKKVEKEEKKKQRIEKELKTVLKEPESESDEEEVIVVKKKKPKKKVVVVEESDTEDEEQPKAVSKKLPAIAQAPPLMAPPMTIKFF